MRIVKFIIIILMFTSLISCAHPPFYSAKEINGAVIDGETDKPLEGVVIVAQWIYWCPFGGHYNRIKVIEAVTDKAGRYHIPGWGPRLRRPLCHLDCYDPRLSIYKSGYRYRGLLNPYDSDKSTRESYWNGKAINLYKFRGDKKALRSMLGSIFTYVFSEQINIFGLRPNYKRVKKMVIEYMKTASEELGIKSFSKEMEKIKEREEKIK